MKQIRTLTILCAAWLCAFACALVCVAQQSETIGRFEGRRVSGVEVVTEGATRDAIAERELLRVVSVAVGEEFSLAAVRESLRALFDSGRGRVANARVEVVEATNVETNQAARAPVLVRFVVKRQARVGEVVIDLIAPPRTDITEDELRARITMLEPGARLTEQTLKTNADQIQAYLRDKGFFRAEVNYETQLDGTGTRASVVYHVTSNEQARIENFRIRVAGFNATDVSRDLALAPGATFSREKLGEDVTRVRQAILREGYLAPQLTDAQVIFDPARNQISVTIEGTVGPKVEVDIEGYKLDEDEARILLPVRREGTIDYSAIVEGRRRLENRLQQDGYFFAEVTERCQINPELPDAGERAFLEPCENLNPEELNSRRVSIVYQVETNRRFRVTDVRLEGTNKLAIEDVEAELRTRERSALGLIPLLGASRRGFTSVALLEQDRRTITDRMRELGYRRASVDVRQGVSLDGEDLIITFVVNEGALTRVASIETRGNKIFTAERLREEACKSLTGCSVIEAPFAGAQARTDAEQILNFYARNGYVDADVRFDIIELPARADGDEQVRIIYTVNENSKVFINRIFINGNLRTNREAILRVIPLKEGAILRADELTQAERALYATDAFRQVLIRTDPAGETASGFAKRDIIIDIEEVKPRVLDYGGGFSTDRGALGIFEIRNTNLFGKLQQGAIRVRASQRQQLLRFEFFDQRFREYGERQFAPLSLSLQYQRDTSVTRFFRSTIDRGNFGIVQRLDAEGKPIDELGQRTGEPTINRFTFNAETQRDFELVLNERGRVLRRSTLFLRYNYEDVRLYNINSLLIAPILRPDRAVRLSRLGASFARDTRNNQLDATAGDFLTVDYSLALRQLGGNISFNKLQTTYRRFYQPGFARRTVFAAALNLGLASIFNPRDRDGNNLIDEGDLSLPISERFFTGGATTLRGFSFEEAGPRAIVQGGVFRNRQGELVTLQPFGVPIGGNALVVLNLEARVSVTRNLQVVPFYDGGNVFRRVSDIIRSDFAAGAANNARARFAHTVGLGIRLKTPFGPLGVDYGLLINPPEFVVQPDPTQPPTGVIRLKRGQFHIRFGQAF